MVNWLRLIKQAYVQVCIEKGYKDLLKQGKPIMILLREIYEYIKRNVKDPEIENLTLERLYVICKLLEFDTKSQVKVFVHPLYADRPHEGAHIVVSVTPHEIDQLMQTTIIEEQKETPIDRAIEVIERAVQEVSRYKYTKLTIKTIKKNSKEATLEIPELKGAEWTEIKEIMSNILFELQLRHEAKLDHTMYSECQYVVRLTNVKICLGYKDKPIIKMLY